jgi:hypothetical protein
MSECPICFEKYSDEVTLICNHKLCLECTTKLHIFECFFKCPLCRKSQDNLSLILVNGKSFTEIMKVLVYDVYDNWGTERRQYVSRLNRSPAPISEDMVR